MRIIGLLILTVFVLPAAAFAAEARVIFAGGCFWGVEAVFEHVKGVTEVRSGYSGGTKDDADYDKVSSGETDHAEAVEVRFDPAKVTYEQLLFVFFTVAHDPTEIDRQGPDIGRQYRSAIFFVGDEQRRSAEAFIKAIDDSKALARPVATKLEPFGAFYPAEAYHQDYVKKNPRDPYVVAHDLPKLAALKQKFPGLFDGAKRSPKK